jgi:hypothetical protein
VLRNKPGKKQAGAEKFWAMNDWSCPFKAFDAIRLGDVDDAGARESDLARTNDCRFEVAFESSNEGPVWPQWQALASVSFHKVRRPELGWDALSPEGLAWRNAYSLAARADRLCN